MSSIGWLIVAVVLAVLVSVWVTSTLTRLDRLHARVDAAQAALDAQLVRRAAALLHLAEMPASGLDPAVARDLAEASRHAMELGIPDRAAIENRIARSITDLARYRERLPAEVVAEVTEAANRVLIARRFFNNAVRDTRTLRARRMPRLLHLAGHRELPQYFDIDDSSLLSGPLDADPSESPTGSSNGFAVETPVETPTVSPNTDPRSTT
jgi:hypothetical protein